MPSSNSRCDEVHYSYQCYEFSHTCVTLVGLICSTNRPQDTGTESLETKFLLGFAFFIFVSKVQSLGIEQHELDSCAGKQLS
jgi:hypothetical protein